MVELDRIIGKLEAHHEHSEKRFDRLEKKVDALWVFRWKIAGLSAGASSVFALLFEWLRH